MNTRSNIPSTKKIIELRDQSIESLHLLLEMIEGVNRTMELKSLLSESMEAARVIMDAEASSLMLLDEDSEELYVSLPTGPAKEEARGKSIPKHKGVGGWVVKNKRPFLSNNPEESDVFFGDIAEDFQTENMVCVPLINRNNKVMGVLQALNRRGGKEFNPEDIPVFEALASHVSVAIQRAKTHERLQSKLQQKEVMLTEMHHRVKNNLATISTLIEVELDEVIDEHSRKVLKNTHTRLRSMTEVHDLLCEKGIFSEIGLGLYLRMLVKKIEETLSDPNKKVKISVYADPLTLSADKTLICGLVLNELLINIYEHAFSEVERGKIDIQLDTIDEGIRLMVSDNGMGVPEEFDLEDTSSVGMWVINILLRKLNATVEIDSGEGTTFTFTFER